MANHGDFQGAAADMYDDKAKASDFVQVSYSKLQSLPGWSLSGSKVLDYGCGTCNYTLPMAEAGATVLAVDVSQRMIELSREKVEQKGLQEKVTLQHLRDTDQLAQLQHQGPFDAAVLCYVLHHAYEHIDGIMKTLHGCLKQGGKLCILELSDTEASKQTRAKQMEERERELAQGGHGHHEHHHGHHAWVPAAKMHALCDAHGFAEEYHEPFTIPEAFGQDTALDCYVMMAGKK